MNEGDKIIERLHGHPKFYDYLKKMASIHSAKNHDYAKTDDPLSNLKLTQTMGWMPGWKSVVIRLGDKFCRLVNFAKKGEFKVKDESFVDTCIDLANYAILCAILFEESKGKRDAVYRTPSEGINK